MQEKSNYTENANKKHIHILKTNSCTQQYTIILTPCMPKTQKSFKQENKRTSTTFNKTIQIFIERKVTNMLHTISKNYYRKEFQDQFKPILFLANYTFQIPLQSKIKIRRWTRKW